MDGFIHNDISHGPWINKISATQFCVCHVTRACNVTSASHCIPAATVTSDLGNIALDTTMADEEVIIISSGESSDDEPISRIARRKILVPVIQRVVDALGGFEGDPPVYRLGDSAQACLSDLKKLWRKDDTDDDRTCAHIFWDSRVLPNDLVPILLVTAGKGLVEDKRAIAAADLCCAMTWPIDMAQELKELDEEGPRVDFTQLLLSHLVYKQALLKPGVMDALFGIVLPSLAKPPKERTPRDGQVVNVVLHIIRNLAFIRDMRRDIRSSADQVELATMQGRLIRQLEDSHFLELLLAIAANEDGDPLFNDWNTLILEIFYLLFRGAKPSSLTTDPAKVRDISYLCTPTKLT